MEQLYNVSTRKPEALEDEQIEPALAQGKVSFQAGKRIPIVNEKTKEEGFAPAESIQTALELGFKVDTPTRKAVREYLKKNEGLSGTAKVALGQFVDEAALGLPELVFDKTADPLEVAKKNALKKEHDLANTVGGVAGGIASFFAPGVGALTKGATKAGEKVTEYVAEKLVTSSAGEIGKRTAKQIAKGILKEGAAKTAGGVAEGLVFAAPRAITETALGDPEDAAESLMLGGLLGGAMGGVIGTSGKLLSEAKKKVSESTKTLGIFDNQLGMRQIFKDKAEEKAVESLNPILSARERLDVTNDIQKVGRDLLDNGIVTPFASKQEIYERLVNKTSEIGKEIGDSLKRYDEAALEKGVPASINTSDLAANIKKDVESKFGNKPAYRQALSKLNNELDYLSGLNQNWGIAEANAQKSAYGDIIKNWGLEQTVDKNFTQEIYKSLNNAIEEKISLISPDELTKFKELKSLYGNLEAAEKIAKKSAAREAANNDFGLTSFITGAGAAGIFGLPGFVIGLAGREGLKRYGDQVQSVLYNKAAGLLAAETAMKRVADKIDTIPSIIKSLSRPGGIKLETLGTGAAFRAFSPENEPSKDYQKAKNQKTKAVDEVTKKAVEWTSNPTKFTNDVTAMVSPLRDGGAPNIANALTLKTTNAIGYLSKALPKAPAPMSPFAKKTLFRPTDAQVHSFEQKLRVINDPFVVLDELKNGTLSNDHMDALKNVYPKVHKMIVNKIQDMVISGEAPSLPYKQRLKLSLLMGVPLDESMSPQTVAMFQQNYVGPDETIDQGNAKDVKIAQDAQSDVQKLMS